MDDSEDVSKDFDFALVEFVHKSKRKKIEDIDVVPTDWITYSKSRKRYLTQFLPAPYDENRSKLLQTLVQKKMDPPEDWPTYTVTLKGRASTFKEALKKLKTLQTEASAITADSDENDDEARKEFETQIKRAKLLSTQATVIQQFKDNDGLQNYDTMDTSSQEHTASPEKSNEYPSTLNAFAPSCSSMSTVSTEKKTDHVPMEPIILSTGDADDLNTIIPANIEFENVCYKEIVSILNEVKDDIKMLTNKQNQIIKFMAGKEVVNASNIKINFKEKYNVEIPFTLLSNFTAFDDQLLTSPLMRKDVSEYVETLVDKDLSISKSFVNMLKDFFRKRVALNFTTRRTSKVNPNKIKFKNTYLCKVMEGVILNKRINNLLETTEPLLTTKLSDVIGNISNWPDDLDI